MNTDSAAISLPPRPRPRARRVAGRIGMAALAGGLLATAALAQPAPAAVPGFPEGATELTAEALRERLSARVFQVTPASGGWWRLEFRDNGYAYIDAHSGFRDSGAWRTEASRLCVAWSKAGAGCQEVRLRDQRLHVKRDSGEVVVLRPN